MCCIVEIAATIWGIITLIRGEVQLLRGRTVRGTPAIVIGCLLTATFPVALGLGIIVGAIMGQNGEIPAESLPMLAAIDAAVVLVTVGPSLVIAMQYGEEDGTRRQRGKKRRRKELEDEYDDDAEG